MRNILFAGAAALSLATVPALAMADDHTETMMELSMEQQAMYDGWPATNKATYDAWPDDIKVYYWGLNSGQQEAWWMLTNDQRVQLYSANQATRTATWNAIMAQMNSQETQAAATTSTSTPATTTRFVSNGMVQSVPTNAVAGEYPVCRGDQTDSCIQPREAGLNYGNRPLDYWPGEPASLDDDG